MHSCECIPALLAWRQRELKKNGAKTTDLDAWEAIFYKDGKHTSWQFIVIGVGAAFLAPLFLNMISSDLIARSKENYYLLFVLVGFCLVASISSRKFIRSISDRVLQEAEEASRKADEIGSRLQDVGRQVAEIERWKRTDEIYEGGEFLNILWSAF
jgi:hypothetical protein